MESWEETARRLDKLYSDLPNAARKQIKNQSVLLILENTRHVFFPVRRLADGRAGRDMSSSVCSAQEIYRYRHELQIEGYIEVPKDSSEYIDFAGRLSKFLYDEFGTVPSQAGKTFWIHASFSHDNILAAFETYDTQGQPEGFGDARNWFVAHPETGIPYPAKIIWGIISGKRGRDFISHQARDSLRRLGLECEQLHPSDLPELDLHDKPHLSEGAERQATRQLRERHPVARKRCIEFYRSRNNGRLLCLACGIDFEVVYGKLGAGFIHVHHLNPIAESQGVRDISPEHDLVPVCPNCHAMIHRGGETRSVAIVRQILEGNHHFN